MASKPKRLLLAAGGTGGHMFPAQALAEEMTKAGWETALITDARGEKLADEADDCCGEYKSETPDCGRQRRANNL